MIILYIFLCIVAFLLLLLLLPLTFKINTSENTFVLKYFCFNINFGKKEKKNIKPKNGVKAKKVKKENKFKKYVKSVGVGNAARDICDILKCFLERLKYFAKHVKFNILNFNLSVATDTAANTAITYGKVCTAAYPVLNLLNNFFNIKQKHFDISSDFSSDKTKFNLVLNIKTLPVFIFIALIPLIPKILKLFRRFKTNE